MVAILTLWPGVRSPEQRHRKDVQCFQEKSIQPSGQGHRGKTTSSQKNHFKKRVSGRSAKVAKYCHEDKDDEEDNCKQEADGGFVQSTSNGEFPGGEKDPVLSLLQLWSQCGAGSISGPGTSTCCGYGQKEKKKKEYLKQRHQGWKSAQVSLGRGREWGWRWLEAVP